MNRDRKRPVFRADENDVSTLTDALAEKAAETTAILEGFYGVPGRRTGGDALGVLVATILSQNKNGVQMR